MRKKKENKREKNLQQHLIALREALDPTHQRNKASWIKRGFFFLTRNKDRTQLHQFMKALYLLGRDLPNLEEYYFARLNSSYGNLSSAVDELYSPLRTPMIIKTLVWEFSREKNPTSDIKEKYLREIAHRAAVYYCQQILKNDRELKKLIERNKEVNEFYHLFKVVLEDKHEPIWGRLNNGCLIKFNIINNRLVPAYLIQEDNSSLTDNEDGDTDNEGSYDIYEEDIEKFAVPTSSNGLKKIRIHPGNQVKLLANKQITLLRKRGIDGGFGGYTVDPLFLDTSYTLYQSGNWIYMDDQGEFPLGASNFKKVNNYLGMRTNERITRGLQIFDPFMKDLADWEPDIYKSYELETESSSNDYAMPIKQIDTSKFNRLVEQEREMAEDIVEFTIGYRKAIKMIVQTISYCFAVSSGFATAVATFKSTAGIDFGRWLVHTFTSNKIDYLVSKGLLPILSTPVAWIVFSVLAAFYLLNAIHLSVRCYQCYQKGQPQPVSKLQLVMLFAIAFGLLGIPLVATVAPAIVVGIYVGAIALIVGIERNRRFTRKSIEEAAFAVSGDKISEVPNRLFNPVFVDDYGKHHNLKGRYKVIGYFILFAVLAVSIVTAFSAAGWLIVLLPPMVSFTWITVFFAVAAIAVLIVVLIATASMTRNASMKLLFKIQSEGFWETVKTFLTPKDTRGKSKGEVAVLTLCYVGMLLLLLPLAIFGSIATYSVGAHKLDSIFLEQYCDVSENIAKIIASIIMIFAIIGRFAFAAINTRDYIQDYIVRHIVTHIKNFGKFIYAKLFHSQSHTYRPIVREIELDTINNLSQGSGYVNRIPPLAGFVSKFSMLLDYFFAWSNAFTNGFFAAGASPDLPTVIEFNPSGTYPLSVNDFFGGEKLYATELTAATFNSAAVSAIAKPSFAAQNRNEEYRVWNLVQSRSQQDREDRRNTRMTQCKAEMTRCKRYKY